MTWQRVITIAIGAGVAVAGFALPGAQPLVGLGGMIIGGGINLERFMGGKKDDADK